MKSVGDILEHVCPCGGDPTGPMHQESLLHREWMLGKAVRAMDPLDDARLRGRTPKAEARELP